MQDRVQRRRLDRPACNLFLIGPTDIGKPLFETASEKYAWLNRVPALGFGRQSPGQVVYRMYAVT